MDSKLLAGAISLLVFCVPAFGQSASLILLESAVEKGAVCLDGSPGGYYFRPGSDEGSSKWILFFQGGGWCYNEAGCVTRQSGSLGSSNFWAPTMSLNGIMSPNANINPDFYNWNVAYFMYCDGASFTGNVDEPVVYNGTTLYFRGGRIFEALIDSVLERGMHGAEDVIVSGCSAGGLAAYLLMDNVREMVPPTVSVKGIPDAGFFLDVPSFNPNAPNIRDRFQYVFRMQQCDRTINRRCIQTLGPENNWRCFFPEYLYPFISTPFFAYNSAYDTWQLDNILGIFCRPPNCGPAEQAAFEEYYNQFVQRFVGLTVIPNNGWYINSCLDHCQSQNNDFWSRMLVADQSAQQTFGNWYYLRNETEFGRRSLLDCPWPCNEHCVTSDVHEEYDDIWL